MIVVKSDGALTDIDTYKEVTMTALDRRWALLKRLETASDSEWVAIMDELRRLEEDGE